MQVEQNSQFLSARNLDLTNLKQLREIIHCIFLEEVVTLRKVQLRKVPAY